MTWVVRECAIHGLIADSAAEVIDGEKCCPVHFPCRVGFGRPCRPCSLRLGASFTVDRVADESTSRCICRKGWGQRPDPRCPVCRPVRRSTATIKTVHKGPGGKP